MVRNFKHQPKSLGYMRKDAILIPPGDPSAFLARNVDCRERRCLVYYLKAFKPPHQYLKGRHSGVPVSMFPPTESNQTYARLSPAGWLPILDARQVRNPTFSRCHLRRGLRCRKAWEGQGRSPHRSARQPIPRTGRSVYPREGKTAWGGEDARKGARGENPPIYETALSEK
jgi:hypothetical protein